MENAQNDFIESMKRKKRARRVRNWILLAVVAALLTAGGFMLYRYVNAEEANVSVVTWKVAAVSEGEIKSVLSGSGTLSAEKSESFTAPADATVETVSVQAGDTVAEGDVLMTLSSDTVQDELDALQDELDTLRSEMAGITQYRSSLAVAATAKGVVKEVRVAAGDLCEDAEYLCLISTDGKMKLTLPAPDGMRKYDAVTVTAENVSCEGIVREITDGIATVIVSKNTFSVGAEAAVTDADGNALGTGTLDVNEYVRVSVRAGRIATVGVSENQSVYKGKTLFTLDKGAPTEDYLDAKDEEADLLEQIADKQDSLTLRAGFAGLVVTLSAEAGDEVDAGGALCTVSGADGLTMSLSIDELDIASVRQGQEVSVTLDALEGTFPGTVRNISYAGSGSYVTSYTATIAIAPIEGAYPGMSASAEIVTDTSGTTLIVSSGALQYDGEQAYLYLAGEGASLGESVAESALDFSALTRVNVTTGMADGSYVAVTGEGLAAGDLIYVPNRTTTAVYSDDEDTVTSFSMGGMGGMSGMGGTMPSGDFGGGNMPSGGFGGDNSGRNTRPGN